MIIDYRWVLPNNYDGNCIVTREYVLQPSSRFYTYKKMISMIIILLYSHGKSYKSMIWI